MSEINRLTCGDAVKWFCSSCKKNKKKTNQTCWQQQSLGWLGDDLWFQRLVGLLVHTQFCHQFFEFKDRRNCWNIWNPKTCVWHFPFCFFFMGGVSSLGEKEVIFATWKPPIWSWFDICTWFIDDPQEWRFRNLSSSERLNNCLILHKIIQ